MQIISPNANNLQFALSCRSMDTSLVGPSNALTALRKRCPIAPWSAHLHINGSVLTLSDNNNRSVGGPSWKRQLSAGESSASWNSLNPRSWKTARIRLRKPNRHETCRTRLENKASHAQASINSASRICQLAIRSLGSGKVLFRGFSGEAAVSVLFRVRLELGSQLRDGGVLIVFNPIILPAGNRRSSVFLTKNLTSNESRESLVFRQQQAVTFIDETMGHERPMLLPNNELRQFATKHY
jgi:hypothetical protein